MKILALAIVIAVATLAVPAGADPVPPVPSDPAPANAPPQTLQGEQEKAPASTPAATDAVPMQPPGDGEDKDEDAYRPDAGDGPGSSDPPDPHY